MRDCVLFFLRKAWNNVRDSRPMLSWSFEFLDAVHIQLYVYSHSDSVLVSHLSIMGEWSSWWSLWEVYYQSCTSSRFLGDDLTTNPSKSLTLYNFRWQGQFFMAFYSSLVLSFFKIAKNQLIIDGLGWKLTKALTLLFWLIVRRTTQLNQVMILSQKKLFISFSIFQAPSLSFSAPTSKQQQMCKSRESPLHQPGLISKALLHSATSHYSPPHSKASSLQSDLWTYIHRSRVLDRAQLLHSYLHASFIRLCSEEKCPYIESKKTWNPKRTNSIWRCDTAFPYSPRWTGESHCCSC